MTTQQTTTESTYTPPDVALPSQRAAEAIIDHIDKCSWSDHGITPSFRYSLETITSIIDQHVRRALPTDAEAIARIEREPLPERLSVDLSQPLTHVDRLRVVAAVYRDDEWLADTLLDIADDIEWEKNRPLLTPTGATHANTRERE